MKFNAQSWVNLNNYQLTTASSSDSDAFTRHPSWEREEPPPLPTSLTEKKEGNAKQAHFAQSFLIGKWKGGCLSGGDAIRLENIFLKISDHTRAFFYQHFSQFNRSLKLSIFQEFELFCNQYNFQQALTEISKIDFENFFQAPRETSANDKIITTFANVYCLRTTIVLMLKIRFLSHLCQVEKILIGVKDLTNVNSLIGKIFKIGSLVELNCSGLESNLYSSWYRPSSETQSYIYQASVLFESIDITQITKIISKLLHSKCPEATESIYSHSLSHTQWGKFINLLILDLPEWGTDQRQNNPIEKNQVFPFQRNFAPLNANSSSPEPVITKFCGDHLPSMAHSHWLAQEANSMLKWKDIILPEFHGSGFTSGKFLKLVYELQLLHNLVNIAVNQQQSPVQYISSIYRQRKNKMSRPGFMGQIPLFELPQEKYDRIVFYLNGNNQSNPHHQLVTAIDKSLVELNENGHLIMLTNQNLFVPSQNQRVDALLRNCEIRVCMKMEGLLGKGELPDYIYLFKKVAKTESNQTFLQFRLSGELSMFSYFEHFYHALNELINVKNSEMSTLIRRNLPENLTMDCYCDAIKEGTLISSSSVDDTQITHPKFFDGLIHSCQRLSDFFGLKQVNTREELYHQEALGFIAQKSSVLKYPLVFLIDARDSDCILLDIIPSHQFEAKKEELGVYTVHYFGAYPKKEFMNINLFRDYFLSALGKQIIQKTLINVTTKLKANLNNILVPKALACANLIPQNLLTPYPFIALDEKELAKIDKTQMQNEFDKLLENANSLFSKYPNHLLGIISHLKTKLFNLAQSYTHFRISPFENPDVQKKIKDLAAYSILQSHPDVYLEFYLENKNEQYLPLTDVETETDVDESDMHSHLILKNNNKKLVKLITDRATADFIYFILTRFKNSPIIQLLKGLRVPRAEQLQEIVTEFNYNQIYLLEYIQKLETLQERLFFDLIKKH